MDDAGTQSTNGDEKPPPPSFAEQVARVLTLVGISCALAAFIVLDEDGKRMASSVIGLALVLLGYFIRKRARDSRD